MQLVERRTMDVPWFGHSNDASPARGAVQLNRNGPGSAGGAVTAGRPTDPDVRCSRIPLIASITIRDGAVRLTCGPFVSHPEGLVRGRRRTVLVSLLGAVMVIAGCGTAPADPATPPNPFPPRPKNLDLTNVDLCATLTTVQKNERGITTGRETAGVTDAGERTSTCNWGNDENSEFYAIQIVEGSTAGALLNEGARVEQISGFGVVRGPADNPDRDPGSPPFCQIPIDASDIRGLRVQYESDVGDAGNPTEQDESCRVATRLAEDVLANLTR